MKKKIAIVLILIGVIFLMPNVMAVEIQGCKTALPSVSIDVKIANTVSTVITVIQIAVPVVLVIMGMLDLFKSVYAQKEDEIKKGRQTFVKRLIAAAVIFFVVAIVRLLVSFVAEDSEGILSCADCFLNGANEFTGVCKK